MTSSLYRENEHRLFIPSQSSRFIKECANTDAPFSLFSLRKNTRVTQIKVQLKRSVTYIRATYCKPKCSTTMVQHSNFCSQLLDVASTGDAVHVTSECSLVPYTTKLIFIHTHYCTTDPVLQFPQGLWQRDSTNVVFHAAPKIKIKGREVG